ncbi:MAG: NACHT domain-containing protein [Lachnospiraceae bacterium]|nr:NACHT domain-containing protein [Lachnospiraceae bacterium]
MMTKLDMLKSFGTKVAEYCVDIAIDKIKEADKNRKVDGQSIETRIYQVVVDALNEFPYNKYKKKEKVYDAAESILKELKRENINYKESVRVGLNMLSSEITEDICEEFLKLFCDEICKEKNRDLAVGYIIHQGERISEQQQQMDRHVQEGFGESYQNEKDILEEVKDVKFLLNAIKGEKGCKTENKRPIVNRVNEYAKKWNENVFLNDFNEEDENAGVNIKLKDIYIEECLPHYVWKKNAQPSDKLKDLLKKYVIDNSDNKMLLIMGQAGIGKSTLITWIMASLVEKKDNILVYQFASDLDNVNWQSENILDDIFNVIGLEYDELENKTLILDGFDEIYAGGERERILNKLDQELKRRNTLKKFSLIITCRENYIYNLQNIKCDYITLQVWDEVQIGNFCRTYWKNCGNEILENKIQKILENKEIFGIPLILYMILALDITIEESSSIVDVYDQVFSLKRGGIYDRCYDTEHRINKPEIKRHIHQVSQRIAFWMFENNADEAFISQEKFEEICENEMSESGEKDEDIQSNTLIGNFFKLKHCEGKGTDELQFVHRTIYEYFVAVYFYESMCRVNAKDKVAGKLGELLKGRRLSNQILEFIKCKFDSLKELPV